MEKIKLGPDHYRYVDELDPKGLEVTCKKFVVIGETEQCWYIVDEFYNNLFGGSQRESMLKQYRKRVLKDGGEHGRRGLFSLPDVTTPTTSYRLAAGPPSAAQRGKDTTCSQSNSP